MIIYASNNEGPCLPVRRPTVAQRVISLSADLPLEDAPTSLLFLLFPPLRLEATMEAERQEEQLLMLKRSALDEGERKDRGSSCVGRICLAYIFVLGAAWMLLSYYDPKRGRLYYVSDDFKITVNLTGYDVFPHSAVKTSQQSDCTTFAQMAAGTWTRREPPVTNVTDLLSPLDLEHSTHAACNAADVDLAQKRYLDVSNWVWQPDACSLKAFDAKAFLAILVQSAGGLVFVGGSISPLSRSKQV